MFRPIGMSEMPLNAKKKVIQYIYPLLRMKKLVFVLMNLLLRCCVYPGKPTVVASGMRPVIADKLRVMTRGRIDLARIALTFDDGPNPKYTKQLLKILHEHQVPATFFPLGSNVQKYPALIQQEHAAGHVIGNHTWDHPKLPTLTPEAQAQELGRTSAILQQTIGVEPGLMRPPYGAANEMVKNVIASQSMTTVLWDLDPQDWNRRGVDVIVNNVLARAHNGAIVLLHDGGGDRSQTVAALPKIIAGLRARGYQLVTVPQLIIDMPG